MAKAHRFIRLIILQMIKGYQYFLSPLLGEHCRFYPSCSHYAFEAIEQHGLIQGLWLSFRRLIRCHPWCTGGCDPIPTSKK